MNLRELKESVKRALDKVKRVHYQNYFAYAYDVNLIYLIPLNHVSYRNSINDLHAFKY